MENLELKTVEFYAGFLKKSQIEHIKKSSTTDRFIIVNSFLSQFEETRGLEFFEKSALVNDIIRLLHNRY